MQLDLCRRYLGQLIAFPTVSAEPNLAAIRWIADRLSAAGAKVEVMEDGTGRKANLYAVLGGDGPGGILLSGHSDVVPVADQDWSSDPFAMAERDGKLYGRGSCDMKGFIAACLASLDRLKHAGRPVHFAFTHDEEVGCLGAQALVGVLKDRKVLPSVAIIGEPTMMQVIEGHKGCCEYTVTFEGTAGHGSAPERGVNAVEYAARYVARLLELRGELVARAPEGSRFDPPWSTINVGGLHGGVAHNVIASRAVLEWETRPVVPEDLDFVKRGISEFAEDVLLPEMRKVAPEADILTETIGEVVGLTPMAENAARDLVLKLTGGNGAGVVPFGTEAGLFQSLGIDAVICGPGSIDQAHKADEYVSLEQLQLCLDLLGQLAATPAA
ncbi:acetylornithine deacetylase [Mangrovicoccus sp. HB161399]|uniref:acetylornithine deacetylase n=1 Tax=Mangrovicoccus sp. HB161399 TaxID=2720392 RepID=UPI001553512D|nr:acetylornithine deacetylase [Mangrovicoccus sp. HB161399]